MIWIFALFAVGMFLSAFFSGSETGFYRATRFRLAIDGLRGDPISRGLLWLTNNPTIFVATTLIGNNLANYFTSRAIVQATHAWFGSGRLLGDLVVPMLVTPFVFIYGELLPKNVFYLAPNKFLRASGPLFIVCGVLFAPVSAVLWILARGIQRVVGESPEFIRLRLARNELQKVINEGHEIGILHDAQRALSSAVIEVGNEQVSQYCSAPLRMPCVSINSPRADVLRVARRHRKNLLLVTGDTPNELLGYVRMIDLHLTEDEWQSAKRPLTKVQRSESHLSTLLQMQCEKEPLAQVVDEEGRSLGIVDSDELLTALLGHHD